VRNNATLTVLPGTSIRFTQGGGGIYVESGATIKMVGLPKIPDTDIDGHIKLFGGNAKGSWQGVDIRSETDNELAYVEIWNAGNGTSAYSSALYLCGGVAGVNNCIITGSGSNGITTEGGGYLRSFAGNAVNNSAKAPIYTYSNLWSLRNMGSGNTFTGNTNNYIHVAGAGSISSNMTIRKLSIPWQLYSTFSVNGDAVLTVEPGTEMRFNSGQGIYVGSDAAIVMNGTAAARITLRGITTNPGAWGDIEIHSNREENSLSYVDIQNGGGGTSAYSSALYLYGGVADVNNCTIAGSGSNGITTESGGYLRSFTGNAVNNSVKAPIYTYSNLWSLRNMGSDNTFTGNTNNYIHVAGAGSISSNMTIRKLSIPWQLYSTFSVSEAAVLTVEPGTEMRFNSGQGIYVNSEAAIVMDGTAESRITLRGVTTNAGAWGNIEIHSNREENSLSYVDIQNGGGGTSAYSSALYLYGGVADVNNCTVTGSGSNGITTEGGGYLRSFTGNAVNNSAKAPIYTYSSIWSLRNIGSGNTFTGNANNYVHINTNTSISGNMTLKKLDIPYFLQAGLSVSDGNGINPTLTIEPGTQIWVNGQQSINIGNNSKLVAVGTPAERIVIRGSADQAGWWHGIVIHTLSEGTRFNYCDISGGGRSTGYSNNNCFFIYAGAYVDIRNTTFNKSNFYYVGFDSNNSLTGYHIYSENVTFGAKGNTTLIANVWYEDASYPTSDTLPANNFTPSP
jgi:uncharacterized RmlC-like cupin family protein